MMTFLRRQSQAVLVFILVVLGFSFLFYGSSGLLTGNGGRGANDFGRIDGDDVSMAQLSSAIHEARNTLLLSGRAKELVSDDVRKQVVQEAWGQLLLQAEADRLHIDITEKQVVEFIESRPMFQKNGVYSPEAYQAQLSDWQNNLHITPDAFENLVRNSLKADAVTRALFSSVRSPAQDTAVQYDRYFGAATVTVATLDPATFASKAQVSPEEIQAEYKEHPQNPAYRTKEKRKVDYVLTYLSPEQVKLTGKDKAAALDALGEKALDFAIAFQPDPSANGTAAPVPPDFSAEAKKRGLTAQTTNYFSDDEQPGGLPPSPAFNRAAFSLSEENPVSKVVQLDDGVAVLHLAGVEASEVRPLEEIQAEIVAHLQQVKGQEALTAAAQSTRVALQDEVKKGTPFATAAEKLNLKVQTFPSFVPAKVKPDNPMITDIAEAVTRLEPGQVSAPVSGYDGSVDFVYLDSRAKGDPAGLTGFSARFQDRQTQELRTLVYVDWADWRSRQPGTHKPPNLDQYGNVD